MNAWGGWSTRNRRSAKAIAGLIGLLGVGACFLLPMELQAQTRIPGSNGWIEIGGNDAGLTLLLHTPSIRKVGSARFYWLLTEDETRNESTYTYNSLDCIGAKMRQREGYVYRNRRQITADKKIRELVPVSPGTIGADVMNEVCN